jgi:hypothetical protein
MFARAGAAVVPGATRLPFVAGGGGEVPDLTLVLDDVGVDRERLAAYDRVCGFDVSDELPATYPHVLSRPPPGGCPAIWGAATARSRAT